MDPRRPATARAVHHGDHMTLLTILLACSTEAPTPEPIAEPTPPTAEELAADWLKTAHPGLGAVHYSIKCATEEPAEPTPDQARTCTVRLHTEDVTYTLACTLGEGARCAPLLPMSTPLPSPEAEADTEEAPEQ